MVLRAQAPEYVPPAAVRRPLSSSSSSTVSFTVGRSAHLKASITPPRPAGSGDALNNHPSLSSLDPKSRPFYPGTGEFVVQFQGSEEICYWIPGLPGLWSVVSEENPSDDGSSQDQSDSEIDSPCYIGKDAYKQLPFSIDATITVPMGPEVINHMVHGQKNSSEHSVISAHKPKSASFGTASSNGDHNNADEEYTQLINEIYGYVQERLMSCGQRNDNPLKDLIHEVLQVINDNPEAFFLKNRKLSQESIVTVQEMKGKERHAIGYGMYSDHFNNLTSGLSKLKDQAQDIEKLLEKNFLDQREKLDELLYDNRRIQVEAGLVLRKFELAIACLETDIAICKHQRIGVQDTLELKKRSNGKCSTSRGDAGTSYMRTYNWPGALFQSSDPPQWLEAVRGQSGVLGMR